MSVFLTFELAIVFLAILWRAFSAPKPSAALQGAGARNGEEVLDPTNKPLFIVLCFVLIVFMGGFRGDFTADYSAYLNSFQNSNLYTYQELFLTKDFGFKFLYKAIRTITNNDIVFFTIVAGITVFCSFSEIRRHSPYVWFSIFLFLTAGTYYVSFNLTRQIMTAGLSLICMRNLYKGHFWRYTLSVFAISLFHQSAMILIPFYFVLQIRWNRKSVCILLLSYLALVSLTYLYANFFIQVAQSIFYDHYNENSYKMAEGVGITLFVKAMFILVFVLAHHKCIDFNDKKENVWFNAVLFYFLFTVAAIKVGILVRFTYYFIPYLVFLLPRIVSRVKYNNLYLICGTIIFLLYSAIARGFLSSIYIFFWQQ